MKNLGIEYSGKTFRDRRVMLDGAIFRACRFLNCEIVYSGGEPPVFLDECYFEGGRSSLEGAAGNTFRYLRAMLVNGSPLRKTLLEDLPELGTAVDNENSFFRVPKR